MNAWVVAGIVAIFAWVGIAVFWFASALFGVAGAADKFGDALQWALIGFLIMRPVFERMR